MENLFASADMAAGYAMHRPAVHPAVLQIASQHINITQGVPALDVGCGSGVSTKAIQDVLPAFGTVVGLEPAESMLRSARATGLLSSAVVGRAENLPFSSRTFGLITAAGSLNYAADLPAFFQEASRVLRSDGTLTVYDFSPGRTIAGEPALRHWFDHEFMTRYPRAADNAKPLDPEILASAQTAASPPLAMTWSTAFQIPLTLDFDFYVNYMMTETNVAYAVRNGTPEVSIRNWCRSTLAPIFAGGPRSVLFEGYLALFAPTELT